VILSVSGTSISPAPFTTTTGNTILAYGYAAATGATLHFTDNVNTGRYAQDAGGTVSTNTTLIARYSNVTGGSKTVTMTSSANVLLRVVVQEWSGLDNLIPVEQIININNGTSTAPSSGATGTLAESGELVVSWAVLIASFQTWTAGSGFTLDPTIGGAAHNQMVEYQVVSGTAPVTGAFTVTGSSQVWVSSAVAYRSAKCSQIAITALGSGILSARADWPGICDKPKLLEGRCG
jgi:hypothetical protein